MSSARQAVHRADNFTGFGKRPDLTPSHQQVLPSGITLSTCGNRKKPGFWNIVHINISLCSNVMSSNLGTAQELLWYESYSNSHQSNYFIKD